MQHSLAARYRNRQTRRRTRVATATAPQQPPNPSILRKELFGRGVPVSENTRTTFGRSLDLDRIQSALNNAGVGYMRPLTDMARETAALDGHLSGLLSKRFNRVVALDWEVVPAKGPGLDEGRADAYAEFVREQINQISNFRNCMLDLAWAAYDGRAASEIQWMRLGDNWHVRSLDWIHPRRISFGPNRELQIVDARFESANFQRRGFCLDSAPYKFIQFAPRLFNDYQEREGLAPRCLYWSYFQRFGTRERMILLELFGKPWRIVKPQKDGVPFNETQAEEAYRVVQALGWHNTARLPPGFDVQVEMPTSTGASIGVHGDAIKDAREVLSKLILGNTATTDAVSTGLGSSVGDAHLSEEDLLIWADAGRLSQAIEDQLTDAIIVVNFGVDDIVHAPMFRLRCEPPLDREKEAKRFHEALDLGLDVAVDEIRQKLGLREIKDGEAFVRKLQLPAELGQQQPSPAPIVIYPSGAEPPPTGEIAPIPEVGIGGDAPPGPGDEQPLLPPGDGVALPPPSTEPLTDDAAEALASKMTADGIDRCPHGKINRCRLCGIERVQDYDIGADGAPEWKVQWRPIRSAPELPGQTPTP